jgi:uncharacterized RDD family membrane protein YckC
MFNKRIYAWIVDFLIACGIQFVLMVFFFFIPLFSNMGVWDMNNIMARELTITYCSVMYLVIRDIMGKKSIGKRIFNLKIINKDDNTEANFAKRILRNVTMLLGPVEIVIFFILKERLGDKIAGTNVVEQ